MSVNPKPRIALVWFTDDLVLARTSAPYRQYHDGFRELGYEVVTVVPAAAAEGYPAPVHTVPCEEDLADPRLWQELKVAAVVGWTWHRMGNVLSAIRTSGAKVINLADSDGQGSPRVHPFASWQFALHNQTTLRGKAGATKYWVRRFLWGYRREHAEAIEGLRQSDCLVFCSKAAADNFASTLRHEGEEELESRLAVVPYPVGAAFHARPISIDREKRVVSIARWDAGQKNGRLMAETIARVAQSRPDVEIVLIGRGGEPVFSDLCRKHPQVTYAGVCPPEQVAQLLATSQVLAMSSRWESGPIVAFEALALGTTVVGTPIANLREFTGADEFGRVSRDHSPASLASALIGELAAWEAGDRRPDEIASYWRARVTPVAVCKTLLGMVGLPSPAISADQPAQGAR